MKYAIGLFAMLLLVIGCVVYVIMPAKAQSQSLDDRDVIAYEYQLVEGVEQAGIITVQVNPFKKSEAERIRDADSKLLYPPVNLTQLNPAPRSQGYVVEQESMFQYAVVSVMIIGTLFSLLWIAHREMHAAHTKHRKAIDDV